MNPKPRLQSDFAVLDKLTKLDGTEQVVADDTIATHAVIEESKLDILFELERRADQFDLRSERDRRVVRVKLWSRLRPHMNTQTVIRCSGKTEGEMALACEYAAAILAEAQCAMYGDTHDPSEVAKLGRRHFNELCAHLRRTQAD